MQAGDDGTERHDPEAALEEHIFPCPSCGSAFRYDPRKQMLVCDHCGNTAEPMVPDGPWGGGGGGGIAELDFQAALDARLPDNEIEVTRVLNCPNCGAQVDFEPATHAAECPFCATPVVSDTGQNRHIKPKGVLPFLLDESDAKTAMTKWLGRLWFAPGGLANYARKGRRLNGIYIPYWTFDAATRSAYRGAQGTIYYERRSVIRNGQRQSQNVQKIRWRGASGRVARAFDDVLVLATRSLPRSFTDALPPWDLSALRPYRPEFIAGFRAESYTVELDTGFHEARSHMNRIIERDIRFDIGGDLQRIEKVETQVSDVTFKHILLPIWVAAYRYRGKSYRFVVNGQTGRVQGERPYSGWKITFAVIVGIIVVAMLAYAYAVSQGISGMPAGY
jgi:DNA-directed RNA polymerase subunit RPC12/RpoP